MKGRPLLTIAIPTYKRDAYLAETLKQLHSELKFCDGHSVEILISDNASPDDTKATVETAIDAGLQIRYIRNSENIGSDANIAQCFNLASGKYVLILGDDDLFVDNALSCLLGRLETEKYGVVCLRPYGFDIDFRQEYPGAGGYEKVFRDPGLFLAEIGPLMTLISSCVVQKSILPKVDAKDFCGENLVQVHLVIQAALVAQENLFISRYLIACKRNNSGGYDFSKVFVENLGHILDQYCDRGLTKKAVVAIEKHLIVGYFPFYLLKQRLNKTGDVVATYQRFLSRYHGHLSFYLWVAPILKLPRLLAIIWGGMATVIGRSINGDLYRGLMFAMNKIGYKTRH